MGLNIKSERTVALVRELARRTGTNQTAAIEDAVSRRLAELNHEHAVGVEARRSTADEILHELGQLLTAEARDAIRQRQSEMYDQNGLPR